MADEEDVPPVLDQPLRLPVNLGDQGAGRVDISEAAVLCFGGDRFGNAVRGENHRPVVGDLVELVDEHCPHRLEPFDDEAVVDDLVADIDRRSEPLERELDDLNRAVDARAKAARRGDQDAKRSSVQHWESHVSLRLQP